jgi:hypothetical protein
MKPSFKESLKKGISSKELLNIPISLSLLHQKEYENMIRLPNEKRRSSSEKNKSIVQTPTHKYITEIY